MSVAAYYGAAPGARFRAPYILAGWSGAYGMLVSMVAARLMMPWFGNSTYVWGAVIFAVLLGFSLGCLSGGLPGRGRGSAAGLTLPLCLAALATLPLIHYARPVCIALAVAAPDLRYGALMAALLLLFAPAFLLGAVFPHAIELLCRHRGRARQMPASLAAWSALAAAAGALLTAFHLVPRFDPPVLLQCAMAFSLALALLAFLRYFPRRAKRGWKF